MSVPSLSAAVTLWKNLCGYDPRKTTIGNWDLKQSFDALDEAVALDPTEITAFLLLSHFVNEHLAAKSFNLLTLIDNPESVTKALETPKQILSLLRSPSLIQARDQFANGLRLAMSKYEAGDREDIHELLLRNDDLAILRRDALRSISKLRVDQFLVGEPETPDVKPIYNKVVHQWWNINSLLAGASKMPSGVSLNLIRDPNIYQSYFCFAIRNGANLFVVSDIPEDAHPLHQYMARRPDRDMMRRASKNWFPYDLLNLAFDEDSRQLFEVASKETSLVAYQPQALPLKDIRELDPLDVIWLAMMFELLVERFWRQGYQAPELSYTAEMLKSESALLGVAAKANLPVKQYAAIGLPALTTQDMHHENIAEAQVGKTHGHPNAWLEERYRDQVKLDSLNLVALPHVEFSGSLASGEVVAVDTKREQHLPSWERERLAATRAHLHRVNSTSFGTRDKLNADRTFIARHNFASEIQVLAEAEYKARKDEIRAWYLAAVEKNLPTILSWAAHPEIWVDDPHLNDTFSSLSATSGLVRCGDPKSKTFKHAAHTILLRRELANMDSYSRLGRAGSNFLGEWKSGNPFCMVTGARGSYEVCISPACAEDLAIIANCSVAELPDVLQHWNLAEPYRGNSILDRIDPMVWVAHNPWTKLNFSLVFGLSKRGLAQVQKAPGFPDVPRVRQDLLERAA